MADGEIVSLVIVATCGVAIAAAIYRYFNRHHEKPMPGGNRDEGDGGS